MNEAIQTLNSKMCCNIAINQSLNICKLKKKLICQKDQVIYQFRTTSAKKGYHHFNLGSEKGYSVKEVKEAFEKITGKELKSSVGPARDGDPPKLVGDSKKAKKELNYHLEYSLDDCIQHTLNYLKAKND